MNLQTNRRLSFRAWTERLKMNDEQQRELQEQLMLCRVMEHILERA
jgi:hypothetical protein